MFNKQNLLDLMFVWIFIFRTVFHELIEKVKPIQHHDLLKTKDFYIPLNRWVLLKRLRKQSMEEDLEGNF